MAYDCRVSKLSFSLALHETAMCGMKIKMYCAASPGRCPVPNEPACGLVSFAFLSSTLHAALDVKFNMHSMRLNDTVL